MNEYLLKLALVVNTSHSKFIDNLTNIIIYVLYTYNSEGKQIKIEDLPKAIEKISGLEFTIKEIKRYIEKYNISKQTEEVKKLIYEFLYNSVQNNIEALLNVATGTDSSQILAQLKKLDNEDRRIINDFIDWDDEQKNELLYEIISFAVDYCCLTIKKDKANFSTLLQGKTFYLDTNILFRMLGLNNEQRKETILQFVNKCKEAKIKLLITSFTKTETLNSIQYHVRQVKKIMQGYTGNGNALSRLYDKSNYEDSFLTVYLAWAMKNGIQGHYDDFHKYLQKEFYELVNEIRTVDAGNIQIPEGILESYISWKDGKITRENAEYDIKNLIFIDRIRKQKSNTMGWNVGEYLISADHKLIKWADRNFSKENPIAVLPSVWYSMLLKLQGRAQNDIKAFSEFIKIRYIQDKPTENIQYLINKVCEKTTNGALQDMLFDEIAKNNEQINELSFKGDEQIDEIVNQAYDDILETTKKEGYSSGEKNGRESGYKQGISRGEKIGRIKVEIEHLQSEISKNALKIRIRNIGITIFVTVLLFVACMFGMYKIPVNFLKNIKIAGKITISLISSGIVGKILWEIFPINLEEIKKIEKEKQQGKLDELDRALKIYEE